MPVPDEMCASDVYKRQDDIRIGNTRRCQRIFVHADCTVIDIPDEYRISSIPDIEAEQKDAVKTAVSYTHLDVYKRQLLCRASYWRSLRFGMAGRKSGRTMPYHKTQHPIWWLKAQIYHRTNHLFLNGVWGVAPSGVRAAAPHTAPSHGEGVWG